MESTTLMMKGSQGSNLSNEKKFTTWMRMTMKLHIIEFHPWILFDGCHQFFDICMLISSM
jgi:hypothetical protein